MGETTKIEWADATINPWWGCSKVSPGCLNCYAMTWAERWGKKLWGNVPREDHREGARKTALKLERQAVAEGRTLRVFCASMADWLDAEVPAEWLADLLDMVHATPHLVWMLLTKRPQMWRERLIAALAWLEGATLFNVPSGQVVRVAAERILVGRMIRDWLRGRPPANVWVGTTVEDQVRADLRLPSLRLIPARVRFLSAEPLLGPVDVRRWLASTAWWCDKCKVGVELGEAAWRGLGITPGFTEALCPNEGCGAVLDAACGPDVHWIIAGGESGHGARPMHPDWPAGLRDQANTAEVAFHFKQWGDHIPRGYVGSGWQASLGKHAVTAHGYVFERVGKHDAGRELDGRTWDELPVPREAAREEALGG